MNLDDLYDIAEDRVETYSARNNLFNNIDKMFYLDFAMPAGVPEWVLKVVSTDPHDAVLTTIRTFATVFPQFKIKPMLNNEDNRDRANEIETALAYNFYQAGRRSENSIVWDVVFSAVMYGEVAAQVVYLPYQEKILKAMGKEVNSNRAKAMKRFGDWAFVIHHPGNVFPTWSEYGLEDVLTVRVQTVDEFIASWGKKAEKLVDRKAYQEGKFDYVTSYDYYNYERRCVWGVPSGVDTITTHPTVKGSGGVKIYDDENELGFIPYAVKRWGNSLSIDSDRRVKPLLQTIYSSGQWDMLNVFESLDASLAMKRAAQPQYAGEFPPGQSPEQDNTEPVSGLNLPQGTRQFTPLPTQTVDSRLENQKNQFRARIWQSSVARILTTLETVSGEAYSSFNQRMTAATNSIVAYKMLGENALSEIAHLMLCWTSYYGDKYGEVDLYGQYFDEKKDKQRLGQEIRISSKTIVPEDLQVEVILTADTPVDKLQQINGAVLMKNNFRVDEAELLEQFGIANPKETAKRRALEDYQNAYIADDIQKIAMQTQLEFAQKQAEMQMKTQSTAMQQEQAARQQEQANANASANASPAMEQMQGMNPATGGIPPVELARGQK